MVARGGNFDLEKKGATDSATFLFIGTFWCFLSKNMGF
jgi:hypothetical protein